MYNAMNISPRPYMPGQGYKTEGESNEATQDSLQENPQDRQRQQNAQEPRTIARGRAPQVANPEGPMVARRGNPVPMGNRPRQLPPKPTNNNQTVPQQRPVMPQQMGGAPMVNQGVPMTHVQQPIQPQRPVQQMGQPMQNPQVAPQAAEQKQVQQMARNNKVNIAQVIKDFRGTIAAIGTPNCLVEEIEDYLGKVIEHTKGDAPSINFVQTNLLNAAVILDKYISDTLEKESRVVQNWLDALFLQRINYSYNEGEVNEDFLVKFPKEEQQPEATKIEEIPEEEPQIQGEIPDYEPVAQEPVAPPPVRAPQPARQTVPIQRAQNPQLKLQQNAAPRREMERRQSVPMVSKPVQKPKVTIIPEDNELKSLFIQAKKHAYSKNPAKAMNILEKALQRAVAVKDEDAQSKICYEMGKIYDDNNYLAQALNNYHRSLQVTTDTSMKTKAHYSMAKIYDDVNQLDSAINHYFNSVSYAGKEDNLSSQSKSLTNIANIYTDKYDPDAFIFYDEANVLVTQTDDSEMKGYVSSNTAGAFNKFNLPDKALKCYADAVKNYTDANQKNSVAENYRAAGELMYDLKHPAKAKVLLKKALLHADPYRDADLVNQIKDLLEEID